MIAFLVGCNCISIGMTFLPMTLFVTVLEAMRKEWVTLRKLSLPLLPDYPPVDRQSLSSVSRKGSLDPKGCLTLQYILLEPGVGGRLLSARSSRTFQDVPRVSSAAPSAPFTPACPIIMAPGVGMPAWEDSVFEDAFNFILSKWQLPQAPFPLFMVACLEVPQPLFFTLPRWPKSAYVLAWFALPFSLFAGLHFLSIMATLVPTYDMFSSLFLLLNIKIWRITVCSLKWQGVPSGDKQCWVCSPLVMAEDLGFQSRPGALPLPLLTFIFIFSFPTPHSPRLVKKIFLETWRFLFSQFLTFSSWDFHLMGS